MYEKNMCLYLEPSPKNYRAYNLHKKSNLTFKVTDYDRYYLLIFGNSFFYTC